MTHAARTRAPKIRPMTPGIPRAARLRAYITGAVISLGLCGVAMRAYALQVDDGPRYRELAARQHAAAVDIPAPRGEVVDVHGRSLAVSADADSIWANPRAIRDVTETAARLAVLLGERDGGVALESKLGTDRRFVWLGRHVAPELARAVREAKLPGIEVVREPRRWYPARAVGGPVVGRADIDGRGLDGIELSMNEALTGVRGAGTAVRDARGRRMFADGMAQPQAGATIQLTLDRSIQAIADQALATAITTHQAKSGTVVVLDVATSRVLALASAPSYDPNTGVGIAQGARNRTITDAFEAGSIMKMFTIATALDDGVVRADTWFDTQGGSMMVGTKRIKDVHHDKSLTTSGIIKRSSNVGTVKIAFQMGRDRLYAGLQRFGFGARTGIELPGEAAGRVRKGSTWREIELATISFGYGITVTPLQVATALAAIGNGGMYTQPRIIDRITGADGRVRSQPVAAPRRAVGAKAAAAMVSAMESVFEGGKESGTAHTIVVPGFQCAGKSGTAHKWDAEAHRYADDRYLSSFAGLAPAKNPRLAIVVLIDEPSGGDYFGGKVAGPVFAAVASESLRYLGVPGVTLECAAPLPGVNPLLVTTPRTCTIPAPKPVKPAKPAVVAAPAPAPEPAPPPDISDVTEPGPAAAQIEIPDFRGMGLGRAIATARSHQLIVSLHGGGRVVSQDPPPGPTAAAPSRITLHFSDEIGESARSTATGPGT